MGRKKKRIRPIIFCYYCDRLFENERVLIQHQRAKHFKCPKCNKRISSAHGMMVHMFQVHQATIESVPAAKEGRDSFDVEIFGMDGVPAEIIEKKRIKVYGESAAKSRKVQNSQMAIAAQSDGIQIPGTRNIFTQFGHITPGQINQGVMPVGQVVGMPMYSGYPGITQVMPQPIPLPLTTVVPTPYTSVLRARQPNTNVILGPGQPLIKHVVSGQKTTTPSTAPPPTPVPQTPPAAKHLARATKTIRPAMSPLLPGKAVARKSSATSVQDMPLPQVSNTQAGKTLSVLPGSSPYVPIAIARQGKAPIIPTLPKPDSIPGYLSPPHMPIVTPQGPPPMHPPPKFSTLPPPPLTLCPATVIPQPQTSLRKASTKKKKKNSVRIYSDDIISQEEKRAMHPKYSAHLNKRITSLSESIEERLKYLQ